MCYKQNDRHGVLPSKKTVETRWRFGLLFLDSVLLGPFKLSVTVLVSTLILEQLSACCTRKECSKKRSYGKSKSTEEYELSFVEARIGRDNRLLPLELVFVMSCRCFLFAQPLRKATRRSDTRNVTTIVGRSFIFSSRNVLYSSREARCVNKDSGKMITNPLELLSFVYRIYFLQHVASGRNLKRVFFVTLFRQLPRALNAASSPDRRAPSTERFQWKVPLRAAQIEIDFCLLSSCDGTIDIAVVHVS